jgi:hypothetical protein
MLGQVDPYQQSTEYTCSAAAEHAVMKHWGYDIDEVTLAHLLKVDPINGSNASRVVSVARSFGFAAESRNFKSIDELKRVTDQDVPVIARVLSWKHPGQYHFVVVTAVDTLGISVMDPNVRGNRRCLTHVEMQHRWQPDCLGVIITPQGYPLAGTLPTRRWLPWLAFGVLAAAAGTYVVMVRRRRRKQNLSGYYRITEPPPPIKEVVRRWACSSDKAYDGTFWYDLDEVWPYREYYWTRSTAREGSKQWDALEASMERRGWTENPAHVIVGRNACAKVGEGNHRLSVARKLGIDRVPVTFHFYQSVETDHPRAHAKCFDKETLCS